jgi:hypothetical protein
MRYLALLEISNQQIWFLIPEFTFRRVSEKLYISVELMLKRLLQIWMGHRSTEMLSQ